MTLNLAALRGEIRRKDTTPERLLEIAELDPQLSRSVAKGKTTPPAVLDRLARSGDMPTRAQVAQNPNTLPATLFHLVDDPQWTVLKALTEHPHFPAELLGKLSCHKRSTVRAAAVRVMLERGPLSQSDWKRLLGDPAEEVRMELAAYAGLDAAQMAAFLQDPAAGVRHTILARGVGAYTHKLTRKPFSLPAPLTPAQVLPLLNDENADVRFYALRMLAKHNFDFLTLPPEERERLATDPALSREVVRLWPQWFRSSEPEAMRRTLASLRVSCDKEVKMHAFRLTDEQTLKSYVASPREEERAEVAARVSDPVTLQKLAQDESSNVRFYLLYNPHLSRELVWQVVESLDLHERRPYQILPLQRPRVFGNPNLTESDWAALLADDSPIVSQDFHHFELSSWAGGDHEVLARMVSYLSRSHLPRVLSKIMNFHNTPQGRADLKKSIQQHAPDLLPRYQKLYER